MNGEKLLTAAKIVAKAGEQIEQIIELLNEKLIEVITDDEKKIRADDDYYHGEIDSSGGWIIKTYLWDIALLQGRSKKPYAHLAVQIMLYDEEECNIRGFQPAIYIMYTPGEDEFDEDSVRISRLLSEDCHLDGEHLWRWDEIDKDDSWMFAVPLVQMQNEEILMKQIVEPVKKLLNSQSPSIAFAGESMAFKFSIDQEGNIIMLAGNNV